MELRVRPVGFCAQTPSRLSVATELKGNINSFLKRSFKYGFYAGIYTVELLAQEADRLLFTKMASDQHCIIHNILPFNSKRISIISYYTRSSADADNALDAFVGQSRSTNISGPFQVK